MASTRVAAYCVSLDATQRLLLVRLNDVTTRPGAWTLPGGGVEFGEHPEKAAIRELYEETGLSGRIVDLVTVGSVHRNLTWPDGTSEPHHSIQIVYRVDITGGELRHEAP